MFEQTEETFEVQFLDEPKFPDMKQRLIRTTSVGSCLRKLQLNIRPELDGYTITPLPAHYAAIKGWVSHTHIKNYLDSGRDYKPDPLIPEELIQPYSIDSPIMIKGLEEVAPKIHANFLKWLDTTELNMTPDNIIGTEYQVIMPVAPPKGVTGNYALRADFDLITKDAIIDFKSGKKSYQKKYKWQLGNYRRLARYQGLHRESPSGDFKLFNIFLGDEEPIEYEQKLKKVKESMTGFDSGLMEFMRIDFLVRNDSKYIAPCKMSMLCAFCRWRHCCRGI